jgi:hypothetical protein
MPKPRPRQLFWTIDDQEGPSLTEQYRDTATKLIDVALVDHGGIDKLSYL